ncbi:short-chain dehydrogenase/reductase SDR [Plectosphaerella plurivora]|uniref:Short-chain dehydrogenase/reductase SDR n=1 Tax=Plectosphaerella plurivora TaxID=936078 RepID=A0A9P9A7D9_9PEZI|nr:short-chain dehydrogenase/reductase SDR [Plectosphaerella plurivora]
MSIEKPTDCFNGGVAVVTGAGGGLGSALARRAAALGMKVIVADIAYSRAQDVASGITAAGGQAEAFAVDVSSASDVEKLADHVFSKHGPVRLLINNAGIEMLGYSWEIPADRLAATVDVNIKGTMYGIRAFAPRMLASGQKCWIANTASTGAFGAVPGQTAYISTKHAVLALTEGLKLELSLCGADVHVSAIMPGLLRTDIFGPDQSLPRHSTEDRVQRYRSKLAGLARTYGMAVDVAADSILEQVTTGKFWVFTHPEEASKFMKHRSDYLKDQREPQILPGAEAGILEPPLSGTHSL